MLGDAKPKLASTALGYVSTTPASAVGGLSLTSANGKSYSLLLSELEEGLLGRHSLPWLIPGPVSSLILLHDGEMDSWRACSWLQGAGFWATRLLARRASVRRPHRAILAN